jgi:hypothetical protein
MAETAGLPSSPQGRIERIQLDDNSDDDDELITPARKKRIITATSTHAPTPESHQSRRSKRLRRKGSTSLDEQRPSTSEDELEDLPSSPAKRRSARLRQEFATQNARSTTLESSPPSAIPVVRRSNLSDIASPETTDEDDIVMVTRPTKRRQSRPRQGDQFLVADDDASEHSSSAATKPRPKGKPRRGDDFVVDDDEIEYISSEEEEGISNNNQSPRIAHSRPSRRQVGPRSRAARTKEEQEELEDDLQDLRDSDNESHASGRRRTRGGPVTTRRDQTREHFQLLKRRRAGEKITRVADSDDEDEQPTDLGLIGQPQRYTSGEESISSDTDSQNVDGTLEQEDDEDDFIEDDTEERSRRPNTDMPLEFTNFASRKPKELFVHILEWLVKNKIAPAFDRNDPVYNLAFARVDDQVKAQAGSRLISPAWGAEFRNAILARPHMKIVSLPGEDEDHMRTCDACNRVNNPARYEFVFSGEPYYTKTLEPVDIDDEDDDRDDEEQEEKQSNTSKDTYDAAGRVIAAQDTRFYLGRFCAANAEMGHKLVHWKWHLNEKLMAYLESQGVLSPESIIAREKMNKKQREKQAVEIVDELEDTGLVDEFWGDFQNDLSDARLGMTDYEKKGGRTKGRVGAIRSKSQGVLREWDTDKFRLKALPQSDSDD